MKGKKADFREMTLYRFERYAALLDAAEKIDSRTHLMVLLDVDAGLRTGEMLTLQWPDVDLRRGIIAVARSKWKGQVTLPKGGKSRMVDMPRDSTLHFKVFLGEPSSRWPNALP